MNRSRLLVPVAGSVLCLAGCGRPAPEPESAPEKPALTEAAPQPPVIHFTDVTAGSGLEFTLTSGGDEPTQILEVKGGGLALIDADGDGQSDVFVPNGATLAAPNAGPGCRLFLNRGGLRFEDATADSGLDFAGWGMGAATGDVDGDGRVDLYITAYGTNRLYRNLGAGRFEDVTLRAGVAGQPDDWSTAASFGDLDGDGDLDLVVVNYLAFDVTQPPPPSTFRGVPVLAGPRGQAPQADRVYENQGDGTFVEVTAAWGFDAAPGWGLGCVVLDIDLDGDQDVYIGNDSMPSRLFINEGPGSFVERGQRRGLATNGDGSPQATMGIAVADINADGWPDLFSTNFASDTNTLHVSVEGRFFDDETRRRGLGMVSYPFVGWSCLFGDFDHDLDEDLLVLNGHTYPQATPETMNSAYRQPPLLFVRDGERFRRESDSDRVGVWVNEAHVDRSSVMDDLDGDGDLDVIIAERGGPLRLLRNDINGGSWLSIEVKPARRSPGAQVTIEANGVTQRRWLVSGVGFLSASAPWAHVALPAGAAAATVTVTAADGTTITTVFDADDLQQRQAIVLPD